MRSLKVFFIIILSLSMNHLYSAQEQLIEQELPTQTDATVKTAVEEKSDLEKWNDHLSLLSENWDAAKNVPSDPWLRPDALDLARAVVKQDKDQASSIKSQFLDKINEVATKFTSDTLAVIKEFDDAIDAQADSVHNEQQEKTQTEPTAATSEVTKPSTSEPVNEPEPTPAPETTTPAAESISTTTPSTEPATATEQEPKKDLETQWKEILESIKNEKEISTEQLNKAAEIARDRIILNRYPQEKLEGEFIKSLRNKPEGTIDVDAAINQFKMTLLYGKQPNSYRSSYMPEISPKELEAHLDAKMHAEKEKQDQRHRETMEALAAQKLAAEKLHGEEKVAAENRILRITQELKTQEASFKQELQKQAQEASRLRAEMMKQQMAAAQKTQSVEKGMFARLTEAVGNWWAGTEEAPKKIPTQLSAKDQETLLEQVVHNARDKEGAKKAFIAFEQTVLDFATITNRAEYNNWVNKMQPLIMDIVVKHNIMGLPEILAIVKQALLASKNIKADKIQTILDAISEKVRKKEAREKAQKEQAEEKKHQEQEIIEQKAAAAQKMKDEEAQKKAAIEAEQKRIEAEQQKRILAASNYKDQKKQWYAFLDTVAQHKGATLNHHKEYTQEALKKSHSLLQLAHDIPHKNKTSISQKLKQKFSLALLEQQKNNDEDPVNIHHYMDVFNNEINKMVD